MHENRSTLKVVLSAVLALGVYIVLFVRIYWRTGFGDQLLAESDLYEYFLPVFLSPVTRWSSYEFAGLPAFADPGEAVQYPVQFVFAHLVGSWAGFVVAAYVLAAIFTYAYVYYLTGSAAAAFVSGLALGLSEAMIERLAHMGFLHGIAWLPLIVLAIDRLRESRRLGWLALGAVAMACCILAGHPQPAVYIGGVAALYAVTGGVAEREKAGYYLRALGVFVLGAILAAVRLVPFVESTTQMARDEIGFGQFVSHTNTPAQLWSAIFPTVLHEGREGPTYVGLVTLLLALTGVFGGWRRGWKVKFWLAVVVGSVLFGLGAYTPLARFVYDYVPIYNQLRVTSRHLFIAAFGAAVLAGIGLSELLSRRVARRWTATVAIGFSAVLLAGVIYINLPASGVIFENRYPLPWHEWGLPAILSDALWTQMVLAFLSLAVFLGLSFSKRPALWMPILVVVVAADLLNAQPFQVYRWGLDSTTIPRKAAEPTVHARELTADLAATHQRLLSVGGSGRDAVAPGTWARIWHVPSAGGYGPMLLRQHSRLSQMGRNGAVPLSTLSAANRALDLLAIKNIFVEPAEIQSQGTFELDGVRWEKSPLGLAIGRSDCGFPYPRSTSLYLPDQVDVASVEIVGYMRCSEHLEQGTEVARLNVMHGETVAHEQVLHAGIEISEIGLDDPALQARAHHKPARTFQDPDGGGRAFYRASIPLAVPQPVSRIDIEAAGTGGWIVIERLSLVDSQGQSHPQTGAEMSLRDPTRWKEIRRFRTSRTSDRDADSNRSDELDYVMYENHRALPRAWLTSNVVSLDEDDAVAAVRTSQLPDGRPFDPRSIALVDASVQPPQTSFAVGASSVTVDRIADGEFDLTVSSDGGGLLVLSESNYPGWKASIDGNPAPVYTADISLQSVVVPGGRHTVEFRFAPASLYAGAAASLFGLLVVAILIVRKPKNG